RQSAGGPRRHQPLLHALPGRDGVPEAPQRRSSSCSGGSRGEAGGRPAGTRGAPGGRGRSRTMKGARPSTVSPSVPVGGPNMNTSKLLAIAVLVALVLGSVVLAQGEVVPSFKKTANKDDKKFQEQVFLLIVRSARAKPREPMFEKGEVKKVKE